jgi:hypothetical protein
MVRSMRTAKARRQSDEASLRPRYERKKTPAGIPQKNKRIRSNLFPKKIKRVRGNLFPKKIKRVRTNPFSNHL